MSFDASDPNRWSQALSKALRAVRKARALRTQDVADRMNLPLRTYEHFEGGGGKINVERIYGYAVATESDPFALVAAALIHAPGLAARSARNKLVLTLAIALHDFDEEAADDIDLLETGHLLTAFTEMFSGLTQEARRRRRAIDDLKRRTNGWGEPPDAGPKGEDDGGSSDDPPPDADPDEDSDDDPK